MSLSRSGHGKRLRNSSFWPLILAAGVIVLALLHQAGQLQFAQGLALQPLQPIERQLTASSTSLQEMLATISDLQTLRQRNEELQRRVDGLIIENVSLHEEIHDYETVRRLLDFAVANPSLNVRGSQITGRVISQDPLNYIDSVQIDLGEEHGIAVGMPVLTERGLVGRIIEVYSQSSKVLLLTDPNSNVSAFIQSSRLQGVLKGQTGTSLLLLDHIPQDILVNPGDIVLTAGLGGFFPPDLVIGQVVSVRQRDYEMFQLAQVRPTVDFRHLEMVLVVTNFLRSESPTP